MYLYIEKVEFSDICLTERLTDINSGACDCTGPVVFQHTTDIGGKFPNMNYEGLSEIHMCRNYHMECLTPVFRLQTRTRT